MVELPKNMTFDIPFVEGVGKRGAPGTQPSTLKDAATVMLLRDGPSGLEVFLQHRVKGMPFAGGMTVFPGGGVDKRDADASVSWAGPSAAEWAGWFGCDESLARALVCAAVRETFEESGVLLAGTADDILADVSPYQQARQALESREVSLAEFLADAGLTLRADLLRPWANWVTPEPEPRRYDTRFFVATLPEGQQADGATTEADSSGWQLPAEALADATEGRRMLMPPTWLMLSELGELPVAADALAVERRIEKIIPNLTRVGDKIRVEMETP